MNFMESPGAKKNKCLDFGSDLDHDPDLGFFLKDFLPLWDRDKLNILCLTFKKNPQVLFAGLFIIAR